ncbi:MAG: hypothetical protein IKP53_04130 [Candidatus Methanomethylophilaceae archaeon]|nr:hypothetical protein [Candidatus Methanomethylophilaceae archaeon]
MVKNFTTRKETLNRMSEMGLVIKDYSESPRLSLSYCLTERGKFIAALETVVEKCVEGTFDIDNDDLEETVKALVSGGK